MIFLKFIFKLSFYITVFQKIISLLGLSGDAHFDDDELFTTGTPNGINLDWVAVHEFGHSMGLEHSNVRESIMYPWYKGYFPNIELTEDDILGIQDIYGKCPGVKARNSTRSCPSRNWDAWIRNSFGENCPVMVPSRLQILLLHLMRQASIIIWVR